MFSASFLVVLSLTTLGRFYKTDPCNEGLLDALESSFVVACCCFKSVSVCHTEIKEDRSHLKHPS